MSSGDSSTNIIEDEIVRKSQKSRASRSVPTFRKGSSAKPAVSWPECVVCFRKLSLAEIAHSPCKQCGVNLCSNICLKEMFAIAERDNILEVKCPNPHCAAPLDDNSMKIDPNRIKKWVTEQLQLRPGGYLGGTEYERWTADDAELIVKDLLMTRRNSIRHFRRQSSAWKARISISQQIPNMDLADIPMQPTLQHHQSQHDFDPNTKFGVPPQLGPHRSRSLPNGNLMGLNGNTLALLQQESDDISHSDDDEEVSDNDGMARHHKLSDWRSNTGTLPTIPDNPHDVDGLPCFCNSSVHSSPYTTASKSKTTSPHHRSSMTAGTPSAFSLEHHNQRRRKRSSLFFRRGRSVSSQNLGNPGNPSNVLNATGRSSTKSISSNGRHHNHSNLKHRRGNSMFSQFKLLSIGRGKTAPQTSPKEKGDHHRHQSRPNHEHIQVPIPKMSPRIQRQRSKSDQPPHRSSNHSNSSKEPSSRRAKRGMSYFRNNLSPRVRSTHTSPRKKSSKNPQLDRRASKSAPIVDTESSTANEAQDKPINLSQRNLLAARFIRKVSTSRSSRNSSRKSSVSDAPSTSAPCTIVPLKPGTPSHAGSDGNGTKPDSQPKRAVFEFPSQTTVDRIALAQIDSEQEDHRSEGPSAGIQSINDEVPPSAGPSLFSAGSSVTNMSVSNMTVHFVPSPRTRTNTNSHHFKAEQSENMNDIEAMDTMEECSCSEHHHHTEIAQKVRWEENDPMETIGNSGTMATLQSEMNTELHSIHETRASQSCSHSNQHSVTNSGMEHLVILDSDIDADPDPDRDGDGTLDLQSTTNIINNSHSATIQTPTPTPQQVPQQLSVGMGLQQIQEKGTFSGDSEFDLQSPTIPETPPSEPTRSGSNSSIEQYFKATLQVQRASTEGKTCVITDSASYRLQRSKSPSDHEMDASSKANGKRNDDDGDDEDASNRRCQCVVL